MEIRVAGTIGESVVDGPGIRFVVFTQGCPHRCPDCHNPDTHDFSGGFTTDINSIIAEMAENKLIHGLTISGGEPLCQAEACAELAQRAKGMGKHVVLYSGYTFEEIVEMANDQLEVLKLLNHIDLLIDGKYEKDKRNLDLAFRGSTNQRIIDVPTSLSLGKTISI